MGGRRSRGSRPLHDQNWGTASEYNVLSAEGFGLFSQAFPPPTQHVPQISVLHPRCTALVKLLSCSFFGPADGHCQHSLPLTALPFLPTPPRSCLQDWPTWMNGPPPVPTCSNCQRPLALVLQVDTWRTLASSKTHPCTATPSWPERHSPQCGAHTQLFPPRASSAAPMLRVGRTPQ